MKLYSYYRSTAAYRVRIALNLKGIQYQLVPVNLLKEEEQSSDFSALNPQKMVPVLEHQGRRFFQSMAILEYLEEVYPQQPLLPESRVARTRVRALANIVACDIHPLNNLRILKYLKNTIDANDSLINGWYRHWIAQGFDAFEAYLQDSSSVLCCEGDSISMADVLLIPQIYNARRFNVDLKSYPLITGIEKHCLGYPEFDEAMPEKQPDLPE